MFLIQGKVATPAENLQSVQSWNASARPQHIVAERSVRSQSNLHDNYDIIFSKYGDVNIATGSIMTKQHVPWYLGMAFPFTLPCVVGGYDVPQCAKWRRPEDEDIPFPRSTLPAWSSHSVPGWCNHSIVGPACKVRLFDLTRGLPQRIEIQFRRHWGFTPALWDLYFRERANLGGSLSVSTLTAGHRKQGNRCRDSSC